MNTTLPLTLAALALLAFQAPLLTAQSAPADDRPALVRWIAPIRFMGVGRIWYDGKLRIAKSGISVFRTSGGDPVAVFGNDARMEDSQSSRKRWLRTAAIGGATVAATYLVSRNTTQGITARFDCPPGQCRVSIIERDWKWPAVSAAAGGTLTWLSWRSSPGGGEIVLWDPRGHIRLRTPSKRHHEQAVRHLYWALRNTLALAPSSGAAKPYPADWIDPRSNPGATQWLR